MNRKLIWVVGGLLLLVGFWAFINNSGPSTPGKYDALASCIKESGATFYGAFWCPHCQNQKAMFGSSVHLLPYTECSTPDGQGQNALCDQKNIQSYPTWEFKDGSRLTGEISLSELATKTGCTLPQ